MPIIPMPMSAHHYPGTDVVFPLWRVVVAVITALVCTVLIYRQMLKNDFMVTGEFTFERVILFVMALLMGILCGLAWPVLPVGIALYWLCNLKRK